MDYAVRRARTRDIRAIRVLVDANSESGRLLDKATVALYEDVQEFWVASNTADEVVGCGALHVMWEDLAEVRTLAVADRSSGRGRRQPACRWPCSTRPGNSASAGSSC